MMPVSLHSPARVDMASPLPTPPKREDDTELRQSFQMFVGEALFGQMLKSMRKTLGKPAYFHGGRGEEVFQSQLDQVLAEKLSEASSDRLTGPMYELFTLPRP
jgi:Rod binding domain-containing protein